MIEPGKPTHYEYRYRKVEGKWSDYREVPGGASARSFELTDLKPFTAYEYQLRAVNEAGAGPASTIQFMTRPDGTMKVPLGGQIASAVRGVDSDGLHAVSEALYALASHAGMETQRERYLGVATEHLYTAADCAYRGRGSTSWALFRPAIQAVSRALFEKVLRDRGCDADKGLSYAWLSGTKKMPAKVEYHCYEDGKYAKELHSELVNKLILPLGARWSDRQGYVTMKDMLDAATHSQEKMVIDHAAGGSIDRPDYDLKALGIAVNLQFSATELLVAGKPPDPQRDQLLRRLRDLRRELKERCWSEVEYRIVR